MSLQTESIRLKLSDLARQIDQAKAARNDAIVALSTKPTDKTAAAMLAKLNETLPRLEDENNAFEDALQHSIARDRENATVEADGARYEAIDRAVSLAAGIQARQRRMGELEAQLTNEQRELERELNACRATALGVTSIRRAGSVETYGSHAGLIAGAVTGGGAYLQSVLDRVIQADNARPAAQARESRAA